MSASKPREPLTGSDSDMETALAELTEDDIRALTDKQSFSRGQSYHQGGMIFDAVRRGAGLRARCLGSSGGPYHVQAELAAAANSKADADKVLACACDCPRGGFCKHIVALLLTWIETPDEFEVQPSIAALLAERSREELLGLIELLLERAPDLERLVEASAPPRPIPPIEPGAAGVPTVDLASVRRRAVSALREWTSSWQHDFYEGGYDDAPDQAIIDEVHALRELGDRYAEAGRWADAREIYTILLEQTLAHYEEHLDPGEDMYAVILGCANGLLRCLDVQPKLPEPDRMSPKTRTTLIETVFSMWRFFNHGYGEPEAAPVFLGHGARAETRPIEEAGLYSPIAPYVQPYYGSFLSESVSIPFAPPGLAVTYGLTEEEEGEFEEDEDLDDDEVQVDLATVLARATTPAERERIEGWMEELAPAGAHRRGAEIRRAAVMMLHALREGPDGSAETLLAAFKDAELWGDAIVLLVALERFDEAATMAARRLPSAIIALGFANLLRAAGDQGVERAIRFVEDRLWETEGKDAREDLLHLSWLSAAYRTHGQPQKAFAMEVKRFAHRKDAAGYSDVQVAATLPGQEPELWERTRPDLLKLLEKENAWDSLVDVQLQEGNVPEALRALKVMESGKRRPKETAHGYTFSGWWQLPQYQLQVAQAAEEQFPDEAIQRYRLLADQAIAQRGRSSYQTAASYLSRVRELLGAQGKAAQWQTLITDLREEHRRLRALKEELDKLGLAPDA